MGQNVMPIAVGGFAGLLALLMLVARGISRPIEGLTTAAEAVAQGRIRDAEKIAIAHKKMLRAPAGAKTRNEVVRLHQAIAGMIGSLDSLLSQVVNSSENVSKSAQRLDESGRQLEATVTEQAASTHQVSATSKEISATAGDLANAMRQVSVVADDAAGLAGEGMRSLSEVRGAMQSLLDATTEISGKLALISEKTANITQVITAITKVANQTNLLSLNAAIEAEKAGQYGLGFSVVAQEIRRLAEQTAVSTLEIEAMIEEMRSTVDAGVSAVGRYTDQAGASSAKVVQIIERLGRLIEQTGQLGARFGDVNEGMQAQSQSASQISEAAKAERNRSLPRRRLQISRRSPNSLTTPWPACRGKFPALPPARPPCCSCYSRSRAIVSDSTPKASSRLRRWSGCARFRARPRTLPGS